MAVIQAGGGGGGLLGGIGKIASMGAMFIPGAQWLAPLGMGMSAVDAAINGSPQGALEQVLGGIASGQFGDWINPASGNMAVPGTEPWNAALQKIKQSQGWGS